MDGGGELDGERGAARERTFWPSFWKVARALGGVRRRLPRGKRMRRRMKASMGGSPAPGAASCGVGVDMRKT